MIKMCVDCKHSDKSISKQPCKKCLDTDMRNRPLFEAKLKLKRRIVK